MQLLGGIFHRRDRQNNNLRNVSNVYKATESVASIASTRQSTDADYVFPDKSTPQVEDVYAGSAAASSSKLKLPFRRKHAPQTGTKDIPPPAATPSDGPAPSYIPGVVSDSGHDLPLPPRKSSLFGIYDDRNMLSTHSLPNEHTKQQSYGDTPSILSHDSRSEPHNAQSSSHPTKKQGSLFAWARERTKSKPSLPPSATPPSLPPIPPVDDSFNLKAFRAVRSPSPAGLVSTSVDDPLPPPPPRPRGGSVASDSSQRISVAAFREAQARRSLANSPVPSFRPPSAADMLRTDSDGRKRASTISTVSASDQPRSAWSPITPTPTTATRPNSSAFRSSSESDESESEDDEEVDSDGVPVQRLVRQRTITRRAAGGRAQSDAGHNSARETSLQRPELPRWSRSDTAQTNHPDPSFSGRTRASASTSALTPSAAARRASVLAAANAALSPPGKELPSCAQPKPPPTRQQNEDSDSSSDSSHSDSEDMPLSTLVTPRRPGSSASVAASQSGDRPRMPAKPLIDIKSLVGSPPALKPILRHEDSVKNLSAKGKQRDLSLDEPFTPPPVLTLSGSLGSQVPSPITPAATRQSPTVASNEPVSQHRRSSSEVPTIQPKAAESDDDILAAVRLVSSFEKEREKSKSPAERGATQPAASALDAPSAVGVSNQIDITVGDRIIPTPIRERKPPASFSVTSRPLQRTSIADNLQMSATSPTSSPATLRSPDIDTRPRSTTIVNSPSSNEKSDTVSVVSTSRSSVSKTSRVPPVPLIDSIPDSPSVKSDYKPGQPPPRPRVTSPSSLKSYTRPASGTLVSLMSSSVASNPSSSQSQSLAPRRPFASNSSVRGESPAGSSTGDSSSGWGVPFTPRDGSEIGVRSPDDGSDVGSTLKPRGHMKKPSVTFEDPQPRGREKVKNEAAGEERRRERRRSEAKAAIELGKIINGRGPLVRDDSDDDLAVNRGRNPRISVNPMMGMEHGMPAMIPQAWGPWPQQAMATGMGGMMPQFNNDPNFLAAHQRALLLAKQAYQMAVAQHAMAVAGEEWERSSNMGGFGSGGSVYGGGSGGSVHDGGRMSMMGMPGMGMLMPPSQWSTGPVAFPGSASAYGGISSSRSEFGGTHGAWGSRSACGDSFGPSSSRSSFMSPSTPSSSASAYGGGTRPRARTGATAPSSSSSGQQFRSSGNSPARTRVAPPSSWKNSR
ncbi:hypothetical protein F5I97DRAFT_1928179 [Phlebopus sp. FC_14]|nr:hypothetical protein F5I97DRAFT_1928179 [Phlebopus sp. FC_14]